MHRCLLIPELVCLLCDELGAMAANSSLAKLAQTCLAFSEPALNALWYELDDLLPLIQCMPCDLWSIGEGEIVVHLISSISCAVADDIYRSFRDQLLQRTGNDSSIMRGAYACLSTMTSVTLKHAISFKP